MLNYLRHPKQFWGFYGHRQNLYNATKPHEGFNILMEMSKDKKNYFVVTSNVDG